MSNARRELVSIYRSALAAVQGLDCVRHFLAARSLTGDVWAVAIGKAAAPMWEGAREALGDRLRGALLITKAGQSGVDGVAANVAVLESAHPYPDGRSLVAGERLLHFIAAAPVEATLLFLISGGASSLVEVLPPEMNLAELQHLNHWLVGSGWDIHRMNVLRKRLSAIKGGRLAARLRGRSALQLLMSDVPGDEPSDIGSGLLSAAETAGIDEGSLPPWLRALLARVPPPPLAPAAAFVPIDTYIVATLDQALATAAAAARRQGYAAHLVPERLQGDAAETGRRIARRLLQGAPGVYLWGGETTVILPTQPGRGGRNQHLALAAAEVLAGHDKVWLLAAGTDGGDGPGGDAGALVDGGTIARGKLVDLDAADCLRRADAGRFLEASGDLLTTGPTGTNVMDVVIALKR